MMFSSNMENKENDAKARQEKANKLSGEPSHPKVRRSVLKEFDPFPPESPLPPKIRVPPEDEEEVFEDAETSLTSYICPVNKSVSDTTTPSNTPYGTRESILIPELKDYRPGQTSNLNDTTDLSFAECVESPSQSNNSYLNATASEDDFEFNYKPKASATVTSSPNGEQQTDMDKVTEVASVDSPKPAVQDTIAMSGEGQVNKTCEGSTSKDETVALLEQFENSKQLTEENLQTKQDSPIKTEKSHEMFEASPDRDANVSQHQQSRCVIEQSDVKSVKGDQLKAADKSFETLQANDENMSRQEETNKTKDSEQDNANSGDTQTTGFTASLDSKTSKQSRAESSIVFVDPQINTTLDSSLNASQNKNELLSDVDPLAIENDDRKQEDESRDTTSDKVENFVTEDPLKINETSEDANKIGFYKTFLDNFTADENFSLSGHVEDHREASKVIDVHENISQKIPEDEQLDKVCKTMDLTAGDNVISSHIQVMDNFEDPSNKKRDSLQTEQLNGTLEIVKDVENEEEYKNVPERVLLNEKTTTQSVPEIHSDIETLEKHGQDTQLPETARLKTFEASLGEEEKNEHNINTKDESKSVSENTATDGNISEDCLQNRSETLSNKTDLLPEKADIELETTVETRTVSKPDEWNDILQTMDESQSISDDRDVPEIQNAEREVLKTLIVASLMIDDIESGNTEIVSELDKGFGETSEKVVDKQNNMNDQSNLENSECTSTEEAARAEATDEMSCELNKTIEESVEELPESDQATIKMCELNSEESAENLPNPELATVGTCELNKSIEESAENLPKYEQATVETCELNKTIEKSAENLPKPELATAENCDLNKSIEESVEELLKSDQATTKICGLSKSIGESAENLPKPELATVGTCELKESTEEGAEELPKSDEATVKTCELNRTIEERAENLPKPELAKAENCDLNKSIKESVEELLKSDQATTKICGLSKSIEESAENLPKPELATVGTCELKQSTEEGAEELPKSDEATVKTCELNRTIEESVENLPKPELATAENCDLNKSIEESVEELLKSDQATTKICGLSKSIEESAENLPKPELATVGTCELKESTEEGAEELPKSDEATVKTCELNRTIEESAEYLPKPELATAENCDLNKSIEESVELLKSDQATTKICGLSKSIEESAENLPKPELATVGTCELKESTEEGAEELPKSDEATVKTCELNRTIEESAEYLPKPELATVGTCELKESTEEGAEELSKSDEATVKTCELNRTIEESAENLPKPELAKAENCDLNKSVKESVEELLKSDQATTKICGLSKSIEESAENLSKPELATVGTCELKESTEEGAEELPKSDEATVKTCELNRTIEESAENLPKPELATVETCDLNKSIEESVEELPKFDQATVETCELNKSVEESAKYVLKLEQVTAETCELNKTIEASAEDLPTSVQTIESETVANKTFDQLNKAVEMNWEKDLPRSDKAACEKTAIGTLDVAETFEASTKDVPKPMPDYEQIEAESEKERVEILSELNKTFEKNTSTSELRNEVTEAESEKVAAEDSEESNKTFEDKNIVECEIKNEQVEVKFEKVVINTLDVLNKSLESVQKSEHSNENKFEGEEVCSLDKTIEAESEIKNEEIEDKLGEHTTENIEIEAKKPEVELPNIQNKEDSVNTQNTTFEHQETDIEAVLETTDTSSIPEQDVAAAEKAVEALAQSLNQTIDVEESAIAEDIIDSPDTTGENLNITIEAIKEESDQFAETVELKKEQSVETKVSEDRTEEPVQIKTEYIPTEKQVSIQESEVNGEVEAKPKIQNRAQCRPNMRERNKTQVIINPVLVKVEPTDSSSRQVPTNGAGEKLLEECKQKRDQLQNDVNQMQTNLKKITEDNIRKDQCILQHALEREVVRDTITKYKKVIHEYQKQFTKQCEELCLQKQESENLAKHFTSTEMAFSDVFEKYEKAKVAIEGFRKNEEILLENIKNAEAVSAQLEARNNEMEEKFNTDLKSAREKVDQEKLFCKQNLAKLQATVKRLEIKASSLETSLKQKTEECQALAALCDDITGRQSN